MNFNRISILTAFALRNRITSRSPHLTETAIESSIANGCQAKRNQPNDFSYYLFEKEKIAEYNSGTNCHPKNFPAALALLDCPSYFSIKLVNNKLDIFQ